ncbi:MAG: hypothetical protein KJO55_08770, partial [Gammaproteobacteria bacterium]|nr:hypothetical protein [Gammaproteobacteria bacterium]
MGRLAIEINDAGLLGVDSGGVRVDSPGYALVDGSVTTGAAAAAQARLQPSRVFSRFWQELSLAALPAGVRGAATMADLAYHHLHDVFSSLETTADEVLLTVPGSYSREQLSLLLGIAREAGLPVSALVDTAVAATTTPKPGKQIIHIDLMLHQVVLTRLQQGGRLRRDKVEVVDECGQREMHAAAARVVSDLFVRNTRYDPMHSAAAEQQMFDRLPDWLSAIERDGSVSASVEFDDKTHSVEVGRDVIGTALESLLARMRRHLATLTRPGEQLVLMIDHRLQQLPGLHKALASEASEVLELPRGAAALGALRLRDEIVSGDGTVSFATSVRWDGQTGARLQPPSATPPVTGDTPTHVIVGDRAWRLQGGALVFGSDPGDEGKNIVLTGELSGISRTHCSLLP